MDKQSTNNAGHEPDKANPNRPLDERVIYRSADGQVEIVAKSQGARRFPRHDYQVICLHLRPRKGTRIQQLEESDGLDVLLTHREIAAQLAALNEVDPKAEYRWRDIPEKSASRKARWDAINAERWAMRRGTVPVQ